MRKVITLILASLLGCLFIFLLNVLTDSLPVSGIILPFGWNGPHYWATPYTPNDHSSGLPFTVYAYNSGEGAYYVSTPAMYLNAASGIGVGLGTWFAFSRLRSKNV